MHTMDSYDCHKCHCTNPNCHSRIVKSTWHCHYSYSHIHFYQMDKCFCITANNMRKRKIKYILILVLPSTYLPDGMLHSIFHNPCWICFCCHILKILVSNCFGKSTYYIIKFKGLIGEKTYLSIKPGLAEQILNWEFLGPLKALP